MSNNPLRNMPSVNEVLAAAALQKAAANHPRVAVVESVRAVLNEIRQRLRLGEPVDGQVDADALATLAARHLQRTMQAKLRRVINATGIVLHTNLGRSPIAEEAAQAAHEAAHGYLNLELDLE